MVRKNRSKRTIAVAAGSAVLIAAGVLYAAEFDDPLDPSTELKVQHAECALFGPDHDKFVKPGGRATARGSVTVSDRWALSNLTEQVAAALPTPPGGTRTGDLTAPSTNTIDLYLFKAMDDAGVAPAPPTTDYEFIRRVTLDLTGRIPTPDAVTAFVNDSTADKRSKYVDSMLASPQWVDKWTMYFGDFLKNNSSNTQIQRFQEGVQGFKTYIKNSLAANKPYDQMTRELIAAQGANSYTQGELNWLIGGIVTGGPQQDLWDQQTANIAESFLGIAHVNCLLCHNGRGHLDSLSLWASQTTRYQAWGLSSFMSRTNFPRTSTGVVNRYYWGVVTDTARYKTDYPLNTTTGNRPARQPSSTQTTIPPQYLFTGQTPTPGQDYRTSLGQFVTSDFQFARASVNYMWAYFFGMGIVDPPNQFDPARLDPDNPPTAPWPTDPTQPWPLQPSNPQLLNALAKDFVASKFDLKALMREIVASRAYQLSARYNGTWNPTSQTLFARKMVRRLWSEELHDAITQSSNIIPTYNNAIYGSTNLAMQLAEPLGTPDGNNGAVNNFLNAFLRGNRDDQPRSGDGSISQALDLMNDNFVMNRIQFSKVPNTSLLAKVAGMPNDQLVNTLFLTVLSRNPTSAEMSAALGNLGASGSTRNQEIENLLWSLYNKVDFTFNY